MNEKQKVNYPVLARVDMTDEYTTYNDLKNGEKVLLLGEISNMPGHVVILRNLFQNEKVSWGYHLETFKILTEDEV